MISVIIPAYNREKSIAASINSVLEQTVQDLEVIVVDDCSTDNTKKSVESVKDSRVRYCCLDKNSGACAARNYGIAAASGEYIAFQDSDDIWMKTKLEKQMAAFDRTDADIVSCAMLASAGERNWVVPDEKLRVEEFKTIDEIIKNSFISTQTIIAKKECFTDTLFDEKMPRMQDWDWVIRAAGRYKVFFVSEPLVKQFRQANSITADPHKGVVAMKRLYEKYSKLFDSNKEAQENYWDKYAYFLSLDKNFPEFRKAAVRSLKVSFNMKKFIKYVLVYLRIYKQPQ